MSRIEIAQSIDESTQSKLTHREGDFNWKLGKRRAPKYQTTSIFTAVYNPGRRRKSTQIVGQKCFATPISLNLFLNSITRIDRSPAGCTSQIE
jgi:hypothetical protein